MNKTIRGVDLKKCIHYALSNLIKLLEITFLLMIIEAYHHFSGLMIIGAMSKPFK